MRPSRVGLPVAVKLCGEHIAHKTERGLVRLGLSDADAVAAAARELLDAARPEDEATGVLVAPMVSGTRELIAGVSHDEQFGPTVLVGIGGVLAEAVADVAIRLVPITEVDAARDARPALHPGPARRVPRRAGGRPLGGGRSAPRAVRPRQGSALDGTDERIVSIDINPLIISQGRPVAVDALVEVTGAAAHRNPDRVAA